MRELLEHEFDGDTKEQEAQQEQTVAAIRHRVNDWKNHLEQNSLELPIGTLDSLALLEIVDSQAQKIAEQAKEIERLKEAWTESNVQDSFESYASSIGIDIRRRVENHTELNYLDDVCEVVWFAYLAGATEFGNVK